MAVMGKRCLSCLYGTVVNGVCSYCGRKERVPSPTSLPREMVLHQRYYIGDVLGQGGFGITYAAWDREGNRRVALKELYPSGDVVRNPDRRTVQIRSGKEQYFSKVQECFEKEGRMLMRLQGLEGVVSLYHLFSDNGTLYYAMEYLDGMDLNARLAQNGRMQWTGLAPMVKVLLQALDRMHREGLIHRDISPDNIFLTREGSPRLIDFGSVRAYQGTEHFTAFVKGYFAPWEQYQTNGEQGPWTDLYAFCVTLYYALSGKLPPMASDRRLKDTAVPLGKFCPELPVHVADAIMYGMAVRVQDRCKSAGELTKLLFPGEGNSSAGTRTASARQEPSAPGARQAAFARLVCRSGQYKGRKWVLRPGSRCRMGRLPGCEISYPDIQGVSRTQCTVFMDEAGRILVRDESSYGTYLGTDRGKIRLEPNRWYPVGGCSILFGQQEVYIIE